MKINNESLSLLKSSDPQVVKWITEVIERHSKLTTSSNGIIPKGEFYTLVTDKEINRTFAKILNVTESLGLPERQENAVRQQIRDIMFTLTDEAYAIEKVSFYSLMGVGFPTSSFMHYEKEEIN